MTHTAKELAQFIFEIDQHTLNYPQEMIDKWKSKLPNLGLALEKLNGTTVESKMAKHPELIEEALEEWQKEIIAGTNKNLSSLLRETIMRSHFAFPMNPQDKIWADEGFGNCDREYTKNIATFLMERIWRRAE